MNILAEKIGKKRFSISFNSKLKMFKYTLFIQGKHVYKEKFHHFFPENMF